MATQATGSYRDWLTAPDVSLFFLLICLIATLVAVPVAILGGMPSLWPGLLIMLLSGNIALMFFSHMAFSLYWGVFGRERTIVWLALAIGLIGLQVVGFLGYILPWGQMRFWLASEWLEAASPYLLLAALGLLFALFILDAYYAYSPSWRERSRRQFGVFILAAAATYGALFLIAAIRLTYFPPEPAFAPEIDFLATPQHIVPEWYYLPWYSILRAVPDKLGGVLVMFAAVIAPVIWPLMRVERLRSSPMRRLWLIAWLLFMACFIALGILGAQLANGIVLLLMRLLAAYHFGFLLVIPPALHLLRKRMSGYQEQTSASRKPL